MKKSILVICLMLALSVVFVGCDQQPVVDDNQGTQTSTTTQNNSGDDNEMKETNPNAAAIAKAKAEANKYAEVENNPVVTMVIKDMGTIKMELFPKTAPESVENFISLINSGFYNGLTFHRTIPGFMAQGGCPLGNGTGGPDYGGIGEFSAHGITNNVSHTGGVLSMARATDMNSAGSQFFIVTTDSTFLDGQYAAFGKVLEGMEVADQIVNSEVHLREADIMNMQITTMEEYMEVMGKLDKPVNPPVIERITVDTFGVTYDEPEKLVQVEE